MSEDTSNHWDLVQTTTGKIIKRTDAVVLEDDRWICQNTDHIGSYPKTGSCRICGEPLHQKRVPVGWAEAS